MLAPVVIIGSGAILMLRMIGADLSTVVLTTGASALIVGLALGDMCKNILGHSFKHITPAWKYPFLSVVQAGPGGASLRLYVYVDDIHLERFMRRQRVITDLREKTVARLQELSQAGG